MDMTSKPSSDTGAISRTMKAVLREQYGPLEVLQIKEIERPTPNDDKVLIEVRAASLNMADQYQMLGKPFFLRLAYGLFRPKSPALGADVSGRVLAVGQNVTRFKPGDEVFGDLSGVGFGSLAEYACAPERILAHKPAGLSFAETAAVPMAATTALQGLCKGQIQAGQKVLIYGASGGVGTFAVQLAKHFGAEVTAVCSTAKVELMRSLGADRVIDYTQEDALASGESYDLILAVNGDRSPSEYKRALTPSGNCVIVGGSLRQIFGAMLLGPLVTLGSKQRFVNLMAQPSADDLGFLGGLLETRKITPVMDRSYTLSQAPEAMRYLGEGRAKGKVVVIIRQ